VREFGVEEFRIEGFGLVEVQTAMVFSRVEVEMGRSLEQLFAFQSGAICRTSSTNFSIIPPFSISYPLHLFTSTRLKQDNTPHL
jgi:hypothetical protein